MEGGNILRRLIYIALVLVAALAAFFMLATPVLAVHAEVFTVTGGTAEQRDTVLDALEASDWDWRWGSDKYPETRIMLAPSLPPFWAQSDHIVFLDDVAGAALGCSYYPSGDIYIDSDLSDALLRQIAMHEAALRPMDVVLKRHVALVAQRVGIEACETRGTW